MKTALPVLLSLVASFAVAATPRTVDSLAYTNTVYTASDVDELLGSVSSEPDPTLVTNLVAESSAQILLDAPQSASWTAYRLILADLWKRVDALDGADGSGYVTASAVEGLVADRVSSEIAVERETWVATNSIAQNTLTRSTSFASGNKSGVAVSLDPNIVTRLYSSYSGSYSLGIGSFSGVGNQPCLLVLARFSSVSWPSGSKVKTAYSYSSGADNYFRVHKINGTVVVERIYP